MLTKTKISSLVVALLFSTTAWGGLGGIAVRSNLGEVLRAEIDLTGASGEEVIRVGLAPVETFRELQVEYSPSLANLRFALAYRANGQPYIRVLSTAPVSDPYLRFVVEARAASGRSIREYTVLLDPAEYPARADAIERSAKPLSVIEPARLKPAPVRTPLPGMEGDVLPRPPRMPPTTVTVRRGQTLAQLARSLGLRGASQRQVMAALMEANPHAFGDGTPGSLKRGAQLKVPSLAAAKRLSEARVAELLGAESAAATAAPKPLPPAQVPAPAPQPPVSASAPAAAAPVLKLEAPDASMAAAAAAQEMALKQAQQKIAELEAQLQALRAAASAGVAQAPVQAPASAAEAATDSGPSLLDSLLEKLPLLAAGLAGVLLLVAGGLFLRRRKSAGRRAAELAGASVLAGNTVSRMHSAPDAGNNTFLSDFTRASTGTVDSSEVDPVAEAEVYLAYGREQQAEDILKDALAKDPSRHEVRLKLMEIYAARRDKPAFDAQARELHSATDGKGALWARAATLGRGLDPSDPLYGGDGAPAAGAAAAVSQDIDLDSELMSAGPASDDDPFAALDDEVAATAATTVAQEVASDDDPLRAALFGRDDGDGTSPALDIESLLDEAGPELALQNEAPAEEEAQNKHMLDFDFHLDDPAAAPAEAVAEPAVGDGFDFDLSALSPAAPPPAAVSTEGLSVSDDPLSTKLDLARVYLDMGDKEGAREVLEELVAEAQGALKGEAESLLAGL